MAKSTLKGITIRFIKFCLVGGSGAALQISITYLATEVGHLYYVFSLVIAIVLVSLWNFTLHSLWTFRKEGSNDTAQ